MSIYVSPGRRRAELGRGMCEVVTLSRKAMPRNWRLANPKVKKHSGVAIKYVPGFLTRMFMALGLSPAQ